MASLNWRLTCVIHLNPSKLLNLFKSRPTVHAVGMTKQYAIQATRTVSSPEGSISVRLPTFYLDAGVQGITTGLQAEMLAAPRRAAPK